MVLDSLPDRPLDPSEVDALANEDAVESVTPMLELRGVVLSFLVEVDGEYHGLHCDHDTAEWTRVVSGTDHDEVAVEYQKWLDADIDRAKEEFDASSGHST